MMEESLEQLQAVLQKNGISCTARGDASLSVSGFSSVYHYREESLTWVRDPEVLQTELCPYAGQYRCMVTDEQAPWLENCDAQIKSSDPRRAFFTIVDALWGEHGKAEISPRAMIEEGAVLGKDVSVGAGASISAQSVIGDRCRIGANAVLRGRVTIGHDTVIQSGAVIGEDGFAFIQGDDKLMFVPHYGGVTIGNYCRVGANACVCRGTIDDTRLMDYAKVDNLCHIAHNVTIGERTQVVAGAVVMGSAQVGHDSWISNSTIRDQRHIGNHVTVGVGAVVVDHVKDGMTVTGVPAKEMKQRKNR